MKKALVLSLFALLINFAFAQVSYKKPRPSNFEIVYPGVTHIVLTDEYFLKLSSDNKFEDTKVTINLGTGKDEAVASLSTIKQMMSDAEDDSYVTIQGYSFLYSSNGGGYLLTTLEYAAGCYRLYPDYIDKVINTLRPTMPLILKQDSNGYYLSKTFTSEGGESYTHNIFLGIDVQSAKEELIKFECSIINSEGARDGFYYKDEKYLVPTLSFHSLTYCRKVGQGRKSRYFEYPGFITKNEIEDCFIYFNAIGKK